MLFPKKFLFFVLLMLIVGCTPVVVQNPPTVTPIPAAPVVEEPSLAEQFGQMMDEAESKMEELAQRYGQPSAPVQLPVSAPPVPVQQPISAPPAPVQAEPAPAANPPAAQPPVPPVDTSGQPIPAGELPDWFNKEAPQANWSAENTCPPPIYPYGASSVLIAEMKYKDAVYHFNISRDVQASQAEAGPRNESNVLVGLAEGVTEVEIVFDGSGYAYPEEMAEAMNGCQLESETSLRGGNWPTKISGIPEGIFVYFHPFGVKEKPEDESERWPDKVYGVKWTDSSGEHTWVSPEWQADPSMISAAEWLLSPQGGNLGSGNDFSLNDPTPQVPEPVANPTPEPTPIPTVQPFDKSCAVNGVIPGGQGDGVTVKACGWVKLSWWVPGDSNEYVLRLYSPDGVTIGPFNGTASSWDHEPTAEEWGKIEPKSTLEQAMEKGIQFSGVYEVR